MPHKKKKKKKTCARLSWTQSAFESTLNSSIVSYRILTALSWQAADILLLCCLTDEWSDNGVVRPPWSVRRVPEPPVRALRIVLRVSARRSVLPRDGPVCTARSRGHGEVYKRSALRQSVTVIVLLIVELMSHLWSEWVSEWHMVR